MRLTKAEERALLRRLEDGNVTSADVMFIEGMLDESGQGSLMRAIVEMTAAMTESATAESSTEAELSVWRERITPILERLAVAEAQKAANHKEALTQDAQARKDRADLKTLRTREIVVPTMVGLIGMATTLIAWATGAG